MHPIVNTKVYSGTVIQAPNFLSDSAIINVQAAIAVPGPLALETVHPITQILDLNVGSLIRIQGGQNGLDLGTQYQQGGIE